MLCSNVFLDVLNAVDLERAEIWQRHTDWSEEQRQSFYEQRKAQIASSFGVSPTQPRGLRGEVKQTLAPNQDVDRSHIVGALPCRFLVWTDTLRRLDSWTPAHRPSLATTPHR